jgi:hypothetical protein
MPGAGDRFARIANRFAHSTRLKIFPRLFTAEATPEVPEGTEE